MYKNRLDELEALTIKMNAEEEDEGICYELTDFFREVPKFVGDSLVSGVPFESNYNKVLPEGEMCITLQGNTVWDECDKKCILDIQVRMASLGDE